MKEFLEKNEDKMLHLLEELVNIDSGSLDKAGVDKIGALLSRKYEALSFVIETIPQEEKGNHLVLTNANRHVPEILIVAHIDTVFPKGTVKERPFSIEGDRAYGPGVIDMKGSHVTLLYALTAVSLENPDALKNIVILLTSDEEIGSPTSRELIEKHTDGKKYALIMEPARQDGSLVTARRGAGVFTLTVKGKAAHAGIEPEAGRSAIEELAQKIVKLHALTDDKKGISVNVGLIEGGVAVNTVAPSATACIDLRISKNEQAKWLEKKISGICEIPDVEGTTIELTGGINRPPMVKNDQSVALLEIIQSVGNELGIELTDVETGGGSDASFTSAKGIATVDGLGPIGGNAHTEAEYLEIPSLVERATLVASVIQRLTASKQQ